MPEDLNIDKLIEQEVKKDTYRKDYNQREDVKERRRLYNQHKQAMAKIARQVMRGDVSKEKGAEMLAALEAEYASLNGSSSSSSSEAAPATTPEE